MDSFHYLPVNRTAARVIRRGANFDPNKKIQTVHRVAPPSLGNLPLHPNKDFQDLTGARRGRLIVVGLLKDSFSRWACRCDCGRYTIRKAKAIKNPNNTQDRCEECRHLAFIQREEVWRRTGRNQSIKDF